MNLKMKSIISACCSVLIAGCNTDADIASYNIAKAADQFEINRRIVFFNGITDTYLLSIEGLCSIRVQHQERQLEVTCKTGSREYKKHHLGLSDNVSYFSEQIKSIPTDVYHYRVIFKPQTIIPDIEINIDN